MAANAALLWLQLLILFYCLQVTRGQSVECLSDCPPILISPVCGEDGNTYMNECLLNCTGIRKRHDGVCGSSPTTPAPCLCSPISNPVCGADGTTYSNLCFLRCAGVEKAGDGRCPPQLTTCDCSKKFEPVCGKDGRNYGNECLLNCAGVEKDHDGVCKRCHCRLILTPVCGMDHRTYDNECFLKCAGVEKRSDGYCVCVCPLIYKPVCGVDKILYDNDCLRQCVGVGLLKVGECPPTSYFPYAHPPPVDCRLTCPCFVYPVCGVDGKTYNNLCHIECAKVKIKHIGNCLGDDLKNYDENGGETVAGYNNKPSKRFNRDRSGKTSARSSGRRRGGQSRKIRNRNVNNMQSW